MRIEQNTGFRVSGIQKQQQAEQNQKAQKQQASTNLKLEQPMFAGNDRVKSIRKQIENMEKQIQLVKESDMSGEQKKDRLEDMQEQLDALNEQLVTVQMEETKKAEEELSEKQQNPTLQEEEEIGVTVELSYGMASADGYMKSIEKPMQVYQKNMTQYKLSVGRMINKKGPLDTAALNKALNSVSRFVAPQMSKADQAMGKAGEENSGEEQQANPTEETEE